MATLSGAAHLLSTTTLTPGQHPAPAVVDHPSPAPVADSFALDLLRLTPIPTIVLDPALAVRHVSDSYCRVSGARREQLLGYAADDLFRAKATLPSFASARQAIRAALQTKRPYQLDDIQPDGRTTWTVRVMPVYRHESLGFIKMELTDTTEQRQKQLELEERLHTNETFRILVETVKDYAIFMLDPQGNIATWNAGAQKFKGYTRDEIVGKHFSTFYGKQDRNDDKPGRELTDALRDGRCEDEGWRYRKDGSKFWANVVITPVYRDHTLIGFSKVTRDLSERRKAEETLITAYEEASKLKSEFLANMSHEIRTPMHGMLSALTLLLDTQLDPEQLEFARIIEESGEVLLHVINDILDYSKLASGSFSITHDIINVTDIIQSVLRANHNMRKTNVVIESRLDAQLPTAAEGDNLRYRQIVQNLMSNATKFTEEGYVRISASVQSEDSASYTILTEVTDTGIGVPSSVASLLFTPFTQFDNSTTKRFKGTGLGLSICKSLAELMGGTIGFRPNAASPRGSTFWFTAQLKKLQHPLPTSLDAVTESAKALALIAPTPTSSPFETIRRAAEHKRILLAEDNAINQKVMSKMLAGLGFTAIDVAHDGREAVEKALAASARKTPYHIILMDINMPVLDGIASTRELRAAGVEVPIVAMTANALKGQAESYIAKGMSAYVSKPVDRRILLKVLLGCLREVEEGGEEG
ncbi:sensor histidine kinase-like protein/response regulator Fos-1 [Corynespora cassiicola Philippines]|uniref:Sensor histidine kinase-like protein/response regulator Fos-1 n=1 Tax=Corynespora cassiicola Philippines TaxID=1448308 RepID=A0A2T2P0L1_CORCC|nr:sensor histidine kinase-like protein/response regulator Fos-1 [Corynespora cassiicola Philippines]